MATASQGELMTMQTKEQQDRRLNFLLTELEKASRYVETLLALNNNDLTLEEARARIEEIKGCDNCTYKSLKLDNYYD